MSNLIDRDKLIKAMSIYVSEGMADSAEDFAEYMRIINEQKIIKPTVNEWISVSERLPEAGQAVYVVVKINPLNDIEYSIGTYYCDDIWGVHYLQHVDVIAWMPIATYKENEQ